MAALDESEECPEVSNEVECAPNSSFEIGECFKTFDEVETRVKEYAVDTRPVPASVNLALENR